MALEKMGIAVEFINMVKVLFQNTKATVYIKGGVGGALLIPLKWKEG